MYQGSRLGTDLGRQDHRREDIGQLTQAIIERPVDDIILVDEPA